VHFDAVVHDLYGNVNESATVMWAVDAEAAGGVSANGTFTAEAAGVWTVYANVTGGVSGSATVTVTTGTSTTVSGGSARVSGSMVTFEVTVVGNVSYAAVVVDDRIYPLSPGAVQSDGSRTYSVTVKLEPGQYSFYFDVRDEEGRAAEPDDGTPVDSEHAETVAATVPETRGGGRTSSMAIWWVLLVLLLLAVGAAVAGFLYLRRRESEEVEGQEVGVAEGAIEPETQNAAEETKESSLSEGSTDAESASEDTSAESPKSAGFTVFPNIEHPIRCNICLGMVKVGLEVVRCEACRKHFHRSCIERVGQCPICGQEFSVEEPESATEDEAGDGLPPGKMPAELKATGGDVGSDPEMDELFEIETGEPSPIPRGKMPEH